MRFRPCIDIHNGKVKQIVGGSLRDEGDCASENFVSGQDAAWYARFYQQDHLRGGHIILLNAADSPEYAGTLRQAKEALAAAPGYFQVGGGVNARNAESFLEAGASRVIVTSYVFRGGRIDEERLEKMVRCVGADRLVLDLSCKWKDDGFYIVTDRWQKMTDVKLSRDVLDRLASCCSEFLIHAAHVEGMQAGPDERLVRLLGEWEGIPVTYAGGIRSEEDILKIRTLGRGRLDFTVGSALDLFGGDLPYRRVLDLCE